MKVIIAGSRSIINYSIVCQAITDSGFEITEVISGGARGVDYLGEQWAARRGIPCRVFHARWRVHGNPAGMIRNQQMGEEGEALIAVWDNQSRGTAHMISVMKKLGKPVFVRIHCPISGTA